MATSTASVPSLASSCMRVLRQRIPTIQDVGSVPFQLIAPILLDRMISVEQMRRLERRSPALLAELAHANAVWRSLAIRTFPTLLDLDHGTDPADAEIEVEPPDWRQWFVEAEAAEAQRELRARAKLRGKMDAIEADKREGRIQVVDVQQRRKRPVAPPKPSTLFGKARAAAKTACAQYIAPPPMFLPTAPSKRSAADVDPPLFRSKRPRVEPVASSSKAPTASSSKSSPAVTAPGNSRIVVRSVPKPSPPLARPAFVPSAAQRPVHRPR